ncbi:amidohydrolase family protein [Pseudonocardia sp. CA-107938]|uniref:amidohydrolase family protein n=1 Tax=Pseudonocardia sp. CA-107938 TaxID=3240021 RepID=UPI003D8C8BF6
MTSADRLPLAQWAPRAQTITRHTTVPVPAVPCIDVHNHLGRWLAPDGDWLVEDVPALVELMDAHHVITVVNLDGRWGDELDANLARYDRAHPGRFLTFCHLDWRALAADDPTPVLCAQLDAAVARGARGLKVWKDLGLGFRDAAGALVLPDDPRLQPVFARAGELGLPVLIHTADPAAFFAPLDRHNERLDELGEHPEWWFGGPGLPSFERLLTALENLVASTPGTTYIGAHVGCYAENLDWVARMFATHPNFHADTGGRFAELGRTPRAFRRLVVAHPDRVLFGTDAYPPTAEAYEVAFRFLETDDEAFDYAPSEEVPPQGRWRISAADLPAELLPAVYAGNAARVLGLQ